MDVPVQKKTWNECFIIGHWCDSCHTIRRMEVVLGDKPHIPYLLGSTFVLWVIYANLFKKSKKVERKKNGFIDVLFDIFFPTVDQQVIDDEFQGYCIDEENKKNGHN